MERINLNIPEAARRELKRVAKRAGRTESEIAREMVLEGLERARREEFYARVAASMTPTARKRLLEIQSAFEGLDG